MNTDYAHLVRSHHGCRAQGSWIVDCPRCSYSVLEDNTQQASAFRWEWGPSTVKEVSRAAIVVAIATRHIQVATDLAKIMRLRTTPAAARDNIGASSAMSSDSTVAVTAATSADANCRGKASTAGAYQPTANPRMTGTVGAMSAGFNSWSRGCNASGITRACSTPNCVVAVGRAVDAIHPGTSYKRQRRSANPGFVSPLAAPPNNVIVPHDATKGMLDGFIPRSLAKYKPCAGLWLRLLKVLSSQAFNIFGLVRARIESCQVLTI